MQNGQYKKTVKAQQNVCREGGMVPKSLKQPGKTQKEVEKNQPYLSFSVCN